MIDYHTHTYLCKHASGEPEEYLAVAEKAGLKELGVSDHSPWPDGYDTECRMLLSQYHIYKDIIEKLQNSDSPVIVKYALEVDWVPGINMDDVFEDVLKNDYDYIIGSVHYTDDFPFDNPDVLHIWKMEGKEEWIWNRYYEELLEYVTYGRFDIIGHFDLPKKFGSKPPKIEKIDKLIDDILTASADNKIAIEINTAGLRKPANEIYPKFDILKKAAEKKMMLTFGSDAHSPNEIASSFKEAIKMAKEAGFSEYQSFTKRKPKSVKF